MDEVARQRAERLHRVFGEVLPETTSDERGDVDADSADSDVDRERWYRENRPPHHG